MMDSIKLPDQTKIDDLKGGYRGKVIHKETGFDDFTNVTRADFDRATVVSVPTRTEEEEDEDDFIPKPLPSTGKKIGVKIGRTYIAKARLAKIIAICAAVLVVYMLFFPPFMLNNEDASGSRYVNIFANSGLSQVKEDIFKNASVHSEEALSSEKAQDYRICTIGFKLRNLSPFELKIDSYSIVLADPMYSDSLVYAAPMNEGGDTVAPFGYESVEVQVLVNVKDMDDKAFDEAVTSMVIRTVGLKKKIGGFYCPCIPAFAMVSNAITFRLED